MPDIYSQQETDQSHSLRYIHIITRNVVGILNRISSLMRRKRYNMEEVSVSFDDHNRAHMIIAVDGTMLDIELVIHQIHKLQDVLDIYDATHLQDQLYMAIYVNVQSRSDFKKFPILPMNVIDKKEVTGVMVEKIITGIFMIPLSRTIEFYDYLRRKKFTYIRRIMSLI